MPRGRKCGRHSEIFAPITFINSLVPRPCYLLFMNVFDDHQIATLSAAFDRAWERYLLTGALLPSELAEVREMLACRILMQARLGEWDPWRLGRDAFVHVWRLKYPEQPPPAGGRVRAGQNYRSTEPLRLRMGSFRRPTQSAWQAGAKARRA
jgi:hypothetical protein